MSFPLQRILLLAQALVALVLLSGLGACSRSEHITDSLTGVGRAAEPFKRVKPPPPPGGVVSLRALALVPASVAGGASSQGTLDLTAAAPASGAVVALASSDTTAAKVPASATIAAGARAGTFTVTTTPVVASRSVTITATLNGVALTATLNVAAGSLVSVTFAPAAITAGSPSQGTVALSSAAARGGAVVALSNNLPAAANVPVSVTIPAGATSATFAVTTPPAVLASSVVVTATLNGVSATGTLAVGASDPCKSLNSLGGAAVLTSMIVPQFRTGRLRVNLVGDVPLGWINAMGPCTATAAPAVTIISGSGDVTLAGTTTSVTSAGGPLTFGPLAVPPVEVGTVLATDAAGNVLQIIWPALAGLPPGPPVLRMNLASWSAAVQTGVALDANFTYVARAADGSTATFTAHGTNMIVPVFVP